MANITAMDKGVLRDCASYLIETLQPLGIHLVYASRTEASFKFTDKRIGSLRVAAKPNVQFNYRWNIYTPETMEPQTTKYKTHWYPVDEAHYFVSRVLGYAETILANSGEQEEAKPEAGQQQDSVPLDAYDNEGQGEG